MKVLKILQRVKDETDETLGGFIVDEDVDVDEETEDDEEKEFEEDVKDSTNMY